LSDTPTLPAARVEDPNLGAEDPLKNKKYFAATLSSGRRAAGRASGESRGSSSPLRRGQPPRGGRGDPRQRHRNETPPPRMKMTHG